MSFLIGCDPEFFLSNGDSFVSSIGKVGGSKDNPLPVGNGCSVQEDNVAVEFNIPPADSANKFYDSIMYALDAAMKRVPGLQFSTVASAEFPDKELQHPNAMKFGCEPDYNAWTGRKNPRPMCSNYKLRSAGGHVHVGCKDIDKKQLIRAMDLHLGVPSIMFDRDTERRKLYGNPGAYRPKPYGAEYRTLSNFWIWDKKLIEWVYHQTANAINFVKAGNTLEKEDGDLIKSAILKQDMDSYHHLQHKYGVF